MIALNGLRWKEVGRKRLFLSLGAGGLTPLESPATLEKSSLRGLTLVELIISTTLVISFLGVFLIAFNTLHRTTDYSQGLSLASSACQSKLEEIISHDFASIRRDYSAGGSPGDTFDFSAQGLTGKGSITITDRRDLYGGGETRATASAGWSARDDMGYAAYDGKMWLTGGSDGSYKNDVWYSTDGANWTRATANAAWSVRDDMTCLVYDNKIWGMGGYGSAINKNDVWYSNDGVNWTQATASAAWAPRNDHAALVYDNKMWILGGQRKDTGAFYDDVWSSADGINWTLETDTAPWSTRQDHAVVVYDNKMWLMGGNISNGPKRKDVWYSTNGANWTQATASAAWSARDDLVCVAYDNRMWVLGGNDGVSKNDVWYSTNGANWTRATANAAWATRDDHGVLVYDNKMWVFAGSSGATKLRDVWYSSGYDRLLEVLITVSWKDRAGRLFGEDRDLDGVLDSGEDTLIVNGRLDSPAQLRTGISEESIQSVKKLFLGRQ